jgi:CDP-diacylglycerol--serine O-phosphatidyltransferase
VIALIGGALLTAPWPTLSVAALLYAATIPVSISSYARVKRQRAAAPAPALKPAADEPAP